MTVVFRNDGYSAQQGDGTVREAIFVQNSGGIVPGTAATALGKAEDAAHVSGDVGVMSLGVANTGATALAANGDYIPFGLSLDGGQYVGSYSVARRTTEGQVKAGAGAVHAVTVAPLTATPTAGLLTVYDSLTETGTVIHSEWVFATAVAHTIILDCAVATGIFVGFDGALANVSVSVSYR